MAMLAERRRRSKFVLTPVAKPLWAADGSTSQFGMKLMEKMGWSAGKGLGATEQGISEPLRAVYKQDSKGMGYSGNGNPFENLDQFNALLSSLSGEVKNPDEAHSFESLEEKSKHSRSRVHYKKFTRGKDISRYSSIDLTCIVGSGRKVEEAAEEEEIIDRTGETENSHGVTTINSGSIADYFKLKLDQKLSNMEREDAVVINGVEGSWGSKGWQANEAINGVADEALREEIMKNSLLSDKIEHQNGDEVEEKAQNTPKKRKRKQLEETISEDMQIEFKKKSKKDHEHSTDEEWPEELKKIKVIDMVDLEEHDVSKKEKRKRRKDRIRLEGNSQRENLALVSDNVANEIIDEDEKEAAVKKKKNKRRVIIKANSEEDAMVPSVFEEATMNYDRDAGEVFSEKKKIKLKEIELDEHAGDISVVVSKQVPNIISQEVANEAITKRKKKSREEKESVDEEALKDCESPVEVEKGKKKKRKKEHSERPIEDEASADVMENIKSEKRDKKKKKMEEKEAIGEGETSQFDGILYENLGDMKEISLDPVEKPVDSHKKQKTRKRRSEKNTRTEVELVINSCDSTTEVHQLGDKNEESIDQRKKRKKDRKKEISSNEKNEGEVLIEKEIITVDERSGTNILPDTQMVDLEEIAQSISDDDAGTKTVHHEDSNEAIAKKKKRSRIQKESVDEEAMIDGQESESSVEVRKVKQKKRKQKDSELQLSKEDEAGPDLLEKTKREKRDKKKKKMERNETTGEGETSQFEDILSQSLEIKEAISTNPIENSGGSDKHKKRKRRIEKSTTLEMDLVTNFCDSTTKEHQLYEENEESLDQRKKRKKDRKKEMTSNEKNEEVLIEKEIITVDERSGTNILPDTPMVDLEEIAQSFVGSNLASLPGYGYSRRSALKVPY